jgi:Fe2+ or Zn2+ uptake regulation protein
MILICSLEPGLQVQIWLETEEVTMNDLVVVGERRLRAARKRITPQRRLVLDILAETRGHLNAYDIYERGRRQDASLSLSTVYRTLSILKEAGVVHELHLDQEHHHYELGSEDEHSHLVCLRCGQVIEVDSASFVEAAVAAGEAHDFEIASTQVELAGYCANCRLPDEESPEQRQ